MARFYGAEIALAVGFLHKYRIIFRDLKPDNVLVAEDGHIRVTDIGVAFRLSKDGKGPNGKCTRVIGADGHKAPEMMKQVCVRGPRFVFL